MPGFNRVTFGGRLGRDPEMSYTTGALAVTKFAVAVNEWNARDKREEPMWINVVAFGKRAEYVAEWCMKGTEVYFDGRLRVRTYTTKAGTEGKSVEVVHDERDNFQITARRKEKVVADDTPDAPIDPSTIDLDENTF